MVPVFSHCRPGGVGGAGQEIEIISSAVRLSSTCISSKCVCSVITLYLASVCLASQFFSKPAAISLCVTAGKHEWAERLSAQLMSARLLFKYEIISKTLRKLSAKQGVPVTQCETLLKAFAEATGSLLRRRVV